MVSGQVSVVSGELSDYPLPIIKLERGILAESQNWPRLLGVGEVKIPGVFD